MNDVLLYKFNKWFKNITDYYKSLVLLTKNNESIGSINEWIVDNYYVISEQEKYVCSEYKYSNINKINKKRREQLYRIIYNYLKTNNYNLSISDLFVCLNHYQEETKDYFTYNEIHYLFIIIRIILIYKLSSFSDLLEDKLNQKQEVNEIFNNINEKLKHNDTINIDDYININQDLIKNHYYMEQINYKLKEFSPLLDEAFIKLNELLLVHNISLKELIKRSHDDKAKENILMINLFHSLKKIAKYKLEYFYLNISYTEKVLISEDVNIYNEMYDNNKYEYRLQITKGAKKRKISEYEYASLLVEKANQEQKHIGWYLFKPKNYKRRVLFYILTIVLGTILLSYIVASYFGMMIFWLSLIPISVVVIEVLSQILAKIVRSKSLFKINFEGDLPPEYSTMVVIPTLLKNKEKVNDMFERLEIYYLSNQTDNIFFTLLGDSPSEDTKDAKYDDEIIAACIEKVNELNEKYGKKLFYYAYRNRTYSEGEGCYLGFERKRGALLQFNKLLLQQLTKEEQQEYFKGHSFEQFNIPIKYVITIDTDTKLVLNTALKMIGAMAHPLNQPVLSADGKKVISGYGIMQPRVGIDVEVTNKSQYSQLFAGLGGLDIYTQACFDLYQDVFNEGSFVGKGIYDLKVFDQVLAETFPNNLILSHDLIEGNYLRCGFINDVELFDDYPARYLNDIARRHRWNRGDWQIIGWLRKKVRNLHNDNVKNPITLLGKWKIFDNLRRSLVSLFLLFILFYGLIFGNETFSYYFIIVSFIIAIPIFFFLISKILHHRKYDRSLKYYLYIIIGIVAVINKSIIVLTVLPYEAKIYVDSIIKAMYRMYISKKRLLNWITAEEVDKTMKYNLITYIKAFKVNYIVAILLVITSLMYKPEDFALVFVLGLIWVFAPFLMYIISGDIKEKTADLEPTEQKEVKEVAVRTWRYFADFLTEENNYLIPDNYQVNREKTVDYKTSPTNIGFSLVSIVSAVELDLIKPKEAVCLITNVIKNVESLNKWNGHLYNWYNIHTKQELYPYFVSSVDSGNFVACLYVVKSFLEKHGNKDIIFRVTKLIEEMDFAKLYNDTANVFSLGYHTIEQILSTCQYNVFASESRLTSYIAIAKGDVPFKHWFSLDKTLTKFKRYKGIVSWSGTAFEYFMPLIFMKTFNHTLLDEAYFFAYYTQKEFIRHLDIDLPWGISESAYNELDDSENYKYSAFGVPYLKMQDGKEYPIIISPYSSIMAIGLNDREVFINMKKFKRLNMYSDYGFYESYDYEDKAVVKTYYAHHQGMILASITNYLNNNIIQDYFHSEKRMQAIEMLLKEKVQIRTYIDLKIAKYKKHHYVKEKHENDIRDYIKLKDIPEVGVLSNGFYSIILDDRGNGFSKYKNLQINRHREIPHDNYGVFLYVKNLINNKIWSNTYAPLNIEPEKYRVTFASDKIKYMREDEGIVTNTEIIAVKDHNAEIRKVTFVNKTNKDAILEVTSYGEIIMCRNEEDIAHRVFNSLTIDTEIDEKNQALIFSRQSMTKENTRYYIIHRLFTDKEEKRDFQYEVRRDHFIGRNQNTNNPVAIFNDYQFSEINGAALDPIISIKKRIKIKPKDKKELYLIVGFGKSREQVNEIIQTYKDEDSIQQAFSLVNVYNNMRTSYANLTARQMRLYNTMLKYVYQVYPRNEKQMNNLKQNKLSQAGLWKFGISGDWPIILVEIGKIENAGFVKEVLQAYEFYKSRALYVDIVIINGEDNRNEKLIMNYIDNLMYRINNLNYFENSPGSVWTIPVNNLTEEEKVLFKTTARLVLDASDTKSLEEQIIKMEKEIPSVNRLSYEVPEIKTNSLLPTDITFYNQYGGFINDGKTYLINNINTPMPWVNVIANQNFGTVVTNNFGGFTYAYNSREYKLTTWSNDLVVDPSSEYLVFKDKIFKPSKVEHGFGYTNYYGEIDNLDIMITIFVSLTESIKYYLVNVTNNNESEPIDVKLITHLVLGVSEEKTARYLVSNYDQKQNMLFTKNIYSNHFADVNTFLTATESISDYDFNDNNKRMISFNISLNKGTTKTFAFMLGCTKEENNLEKFNNLSKVQMAYKEVTNYWDEKLSSLVVKTPDQAFNYVLNGWYLYQALASRLYARAGFYQAGGALGFRDQLQDVLSVMYTDSEYAKAQILKHAKHQFKEGDVLHWWHEETGNGIRTEFSDDYLWLVYVTSEYLRITGDKAILKEQVPFVNGELLGENESEKGMDFYYTVETESFYEHLKLCIDKTLNQFGIHGIPLMGSGDWNDGMNRVGHKGRGESVFMGFFVYDLLKRMAIISKDYDDEEFAQKCLDKTEDLKTALHQNAWDGAWYLRAFFDNGVSLGSRNNRECQIDLLSQSWSILSEVATDKQRQSIHQEVNNHLIDKEHKIIKLLTPPFKYTRNNPGYIKHYIEGVRENGGQYTHAALWYIMALLRDNQFDLGYQCYQMLNPINHTLNNNDVNIYKVEPYVIAADVYSNIGHPGRGGWTWYTGSASWAYKVGIEEILGFKKEGDTLKIEPKIPTTWSHFTIQYRYLNTNYKIKVNNQKPTGKIKLTLDNKEVKNNFITLIDDQKDHEILVDILEE